MAEPSGRVHSQIEFMGKKISIVWGAISISLLLFLFVGGCATRGEIKRFQAQVDSLSVSNKMQSRQLLVLDSILTEQGRLLRTIRAEQNTGMNSLQEQMRIVESIMRDSGFKVSSLTQKIQSIEQGLIVPTVSDSAHAMDTTLQEPKARGEEIYTTAFRDLSRGNYELAISGFEAYLEQYPEGPRADDSRYNIGEALLALGNYEEAAFSFLALTRKWPKSEFVPQSLFKAGRCYEQLGQKGLAEKYYNQVVKEHPGSAEAELSKQRLKEIKGK